MPWSKVKNVGAIAGSILTIVSLGALLFNWYNNYSEQAKIEHEQELEVFVTEVFAKVSDNIVTETKAELTKNKLLLDSLQSVINQMQKGSEYFAVGLRGDGSGKLWYRNEYGKLYQAFFNGEYGQYYYINENGLAVYI